MMGGMERDRDVQGMERTIDPGRSAVRPEGTPLYVHVPFCVQKCTYCDFYSRPGTPAEIDQVVEDLLTEARRRAPWRPPTVFVGGGTPTIFSTTQLRRLFDGLQAITSFRESATEISIESNPESLSAEKAAVLRDLGVNRLTVGVQSLRPGLLELFGRVHSAREGLIAIEAALDQGIASVGADLIYAAPGQNLGEWEADLARVLALGLHHISAYCLAFEEDTALTGSSPRARSRSWARKSSWNSSTGRAESCTHIDCPPMRCPISP